MLQIMVPLAWLQVQITVLVSNQRTFSLSEFNEFRASSFTTGEVTAKTFNLPQLHQISAAPVVEEKTVLNHHWRIYQQAVALDLDPWPLVGT